MYGEDDVSTLCDTPPFDVEYVVNNAANDAEILQRMMEYVETITDEDDQYMKMLTEKLPNEVNWKRPWYQKATLRIRVSLKELKQDSEYAEGDCRTDKITKTESDFIFKRWKKLMKKHNLPSKPLCFSRYRRRIRANSEKLNAMRIYVAAYMAKGLERTVYQVDNHFKRRFGYSKRYKFTPQELVAMKVCYERYPSNSSVIMGLVLGREIRAFNKYFAEVFKRQELPAPAMPMKWTWTLESSTKLVNSILKRSKMDLKQLRNNQLTPKIWRKIERDMMKAYGIPTSSLRQQWYGKLHLQLFGKKDVNVCDLRIKIFEALKTFPEYKVWVDIRWNDVVKHLQKGLTPKYAHYLASRSFRCFPQFMKGLPLQEGVEFALKRIKRSKETYKKLVYHENRLKYADELEEKEKTKEIKTNKKRIKE